MTPDFRLSTPDFRLSTILVTGGLGFIGSNLVPESGKKGLGRRGNG